MKLYVTSRAPNPDRVVFFARAKGILDTMELIDISIMKGEHKTEAYGQVSPFNQTPTLQLDDGVSLTESRAICTYLEALHPTTPNLLGDTPLEKAEFEMWERRVEFKGMGNIAGWFRHAHPAMAELEKPQNAAYAEASHAKLKVFLTWLDGHLTGREFLADRFSNADIALFVSCNFCRMMQYKPDAEFPAIGAHYARIKAMGITG